MATLGAALGGASGWQHRPVPGGEQTKRSRAGAVLHPRPLPWRPTHRRSRPGTLPGCSARRSRERSEVGRLEGEVPCAGSSYLGVDLLVDGAFCLLLLLHGQQVHQRADGHALQKRAGSLLTQRRCSPLRGQERRVEPASPGAGLISRLEQTLPSWSQPAWSTFPYRTTSASGMS